MQRWRLAAWLSAAGLAAGFFASFAITPRYTSRAVFSLKTPGAYSLLEHAELEVKSRASLVRLINTPGLNLYALERTREPMEDIEDEMRPDLIFQSCQ